MSQNTTPPRHATISPSTPTLRAWAASIVAALADPDPPPSVERVGADLRHALGIRCVTDRKRTLIGWRARYGVASVRFKRFKSNADFVQHYMLQDECDEKLARLGLITEAHPNARMTWTGRRALRVPRALLCRVPVRRSRSRSHRSHRAGSARLVKLDAGDPEPIGNWTVAMARAAVNVALQRVLIVLVLVVIVRSGAPHHQAPGTCRGFGPEVEPAEFVGDLDDVSKTKRPDLHRCGWPSLQPIATASAYVSRSRWTLYRAVARGELPVAGRRGRALVFRREDLDRWMLGGIAAAPADITGGES